MSIRSGEETVGGISTEGSVELCFVQSCMFNDLRSSYM